MENFIVSSKLYRDKYGILSSNFDLDVQNLLSNLNIKIIPYLNFKNKFSNKIKDAEGLILLGGGDIYKYNKKKENQIRDKIEIKLFREFYKTNKPILAICRGFQLIMDAYKIPLIKNDGHVRKKHKLIIKNSRFIKYKNLSVNSFHNYSVFKLPNDFKYVSMHQDGSVEIAEHKKKKILCLMFHPERKMNSQKNLLKVLKEFFK
jgi:gamma-glutamyl-gamma-aminobutyrate hydrolase PuuD